MARNTDKNALSITFPLLPVVRFNLGDGLTKPLILDIITPDWIRENVTFDAIDYETAADALMVEKVLLSAKAKRAWDKDTDDVDALAEFLTLKLTIKPRNERIISCSTFVAENVEKLPFLDTLEDVQIRALIETTHPDYIVID